MGGAMEQETVVAVVPQDVRYDLTLARAPKQVLAEAIDASKALKSVVSSRKDAVKFNGKQYLTFEDYQTLGRFYGITAKVISTEYVEFGDLKGFLAKAEAIRTETGAVVSAAEAMCLTDEPNWMKKPLFQLRSMAQTRAAGKSLRNVLAWVAVLAGYDASLAEEMTGDEHQSQPKQDPPKPPQEKKAETPFSQDGGLYISDSQRKRFYAIWKSKGKTQDDVRMYLASKGIPDDKHIPVSAYEDACAWAEFQSNA